MKTLFTILSPTLALLVLTAVGPARAADDLTFEWSRATLELIAAGDPARGEQLAEKAKCAKCHGEAGIAEDDETPSIAGQVPAYQFKQLLEYKTRVRDSRDMYKKTRRLSPAELADLAAYFATLPAEPPRDVSAPPLLVSAGDKERLLLPCQVCHGEEGEGLGFEVPALAGQKIDHFIETMTAFRDGDRENDQYARMRFIARQLTETEIAELAAYYAAERVPEDAGDG